MIPIIIIIIIIRIFQMINTKLNPLKISIEEIVKIMILIQIIVLLMNQKLK